MSLFYCGEELIYAIYLEERNDSCILQNIYGDLMIKYLIYICYFIYKRLKYINNNNYYMNFTNNIIPGTKWKITV